MVISREKPQNSKLFLLIYSVSLRYGAFASAWLPQKRTETQVQGGSVSHLPLKLSTSSSIRKMQSYESNFYDFRLVSEIPIPTLPRKTSASFCELSSLRMGDSMS